MNGGDYGDNRNIVRNVTCNSCFLAGGGVMSYPGLIDETPLESKEREHQEYHIAEHIFEEGCNWCIVEKCNQCKGRGMSENGALVCGKCDGRGRII